MIGKLIGGRYEILRQIGRGAFGTTFLAVDRQLPDNFQCVVKQLQPSSTEPEILREARRLFDAEAKALNLLGDCDRIPRLLAHFEEDEQFYLVQELIQGEGIEREMFLGHLWSEADAIALIQGVLEVLDFVHQHHIIHRDIKPSNLIRRYSDRKIVLIDFGAVKQVRTQLVTPDGATAYTVAVGTNGYMPSEQSQGKPRPCSDIYALGVVGIQAVTGLPIAQIPEDPQTGELIWRDLSNVSDAFAAVLTKMTRYNFSERYQSASAALDAIASVNPQGTIPQRYAIPQRKLPEVETVAAKPPRKYHPLAIAGAVAVALGLGLIGWQFFDPEGVSAYENRSWGVGLKYPKNWQPEEREILKAGLSTKFASPLENSSDAFQESLTLNVQNFNGKTLDDFTRVSLQDIKRIAPDSEILERKYTKLANLPAYQVVYLRQESGKKLKNLETWTVNADKAYLLTYSAESDKYDRYLPKVEQSLKSFHFLQVP